MDIAKEIINKFITTTESEESICFIGADGTAVNTGVNNDVI